MDPERLAAILLMNSMPTSVQLKPIVPLCDKRRDSTDRSPFGIGGSETNASKASQRVLI
jgi:hypothetical protein